MCVCVCVCELKNAGTDNSRNMNSLLGIDDNMQVQYCQSQYAV